MEPAVTREWRQFECTAKRCEWRGPMPAWSDAQPIAENRNGQRPMKVIPICPRCLADARMTP